MTSVHLEVGRSGPRSCWCVRRRGHFGQEARLAQLKQAMARTFSRWQVLGYHVFWWPKSWGIRLPYGPSAVRDADVRCMRVRSAPRPSAALLALRPHQPTQGGEDVRAQAAVLTLEGCRRLG